MPPVVWTSGATTLTFDQGIIRGPHRFPVSRVVSERLAGGAIVAYELSGLSDLEVIECEFPHVTKTKLTDALSFKDTTVKDMLNTFTHTDNSESPALVKTVRLLEFEQVPERYTDPAAPRFTILARLQVEPS